MELESIAAGEGWIFYQGDLGIFFPSQTGTYSTLVNSNPFYPLEKK